jgi:CRP-like cAMP-binding protein
MSIMSDLRPRGLPITRSRIEKIFPKLTPDQISRVASHGHIRSIQRDQILAEQGDASVPFFVVISGEIEIVQPTVGSTEIIVTTYDTGQFTGEFNTFSGRRALFRWRVAKSGEAIEIDRQHMLALVQNDSELGDIMMRAFVLRIMACRFLKLRHRLHSHLEKSLIGRTMQYIIDRTENFDYYFPCGKPKCRIKHVINWLNLFINFHNDKLNIR